MSLVGRTWSAASQFSPADIPGIGLWLDAADSNAFVFTTGSNIYRWLDKSGLSNHGDISTNIVQTGRSPTREANAINGLPAVSFSNSNSLMGRLGMAGPLRTITGFVVVRPLQSAVGRGGQTIVSTGLGNGGDTGNNVFTIYIPGNLNRIDFQRNFGATPPRFDISADIAAGRPLLITWSSALSQSYLWSNGSPGLDFGRVLNAGFSIQTYAIGRAIYGGATNLVGTIGEVLLYNAALPTFQRNLVERYLATKWGLPLPSNNVYPVSLPSVPTRRFSPVDMPNLTCWFDAMDPCGYLLSGSTVTRLFDKSSNRAFSGTVTSNYTWGPSQFNGSYPSFRTTVGGTLATNSVAYIGDGGGTMYIVAHDTSQSANNWLFQTGGGIPLGISNGFVFNGTFPANTGECSQPFIASLMISNSFTGCFGRINGTQQAGGHIYGGPGFTLGNRNSRLNPFVGHICEFLMYSTTHLPAEQDMVEAYLAQKWGLCNKTATTSAFYTGAAISAPIHPFRYTPSPLTSPTDLSNLRLWVDALDPCGSIAPGGAVTRVLDKSPCNWTFSNAVGNPGWVRRTFLGDKPAFYGYGGGSGGPLAQNTSFDVCQPLTIYFYGAFPTGVGGQTVLIDSSQTVSRVLLHAPNILNAGTAVTHNGGVPTFGPYFVSAAVDASRTSFTINGVQMAPISVGTGRMGGVRIGAGSPGNMTGFIGEVLLYAGSHTRTQQQQVEGYLIWKWGAQTAMPSFGWGRRFLPQSPTFSPLHVAGLTLWLDSADNTTLTLSGNAVTRWADKSGLQNDASGGVSPTWSSNGIVFDGTSSYLATPYTADPSAESIFAVATWTGNTDGSYAILGTDTAAGRSFLVDRATSTQTSIRWDTWGVRAAARTFGVRSNVRLLTTGLFNGARVQTSIYGGTFTALADTSFIGTPRTNIGAGVSSAYFNGTIHEVLTYSSVISSDERQRVEAYLAWKWGLNGDLSLGNPYRTFKP
jgi:hypothetical protein